MLEYIGARALIERELRLTDFLVLLTTVANIGKILSFFECRQLRICNYVCVLCGGNRSTVTAFQKSGLVSKFMPDFM